jgi:hypothetical protein
VSLKLITTSAVAVALLCGCATGPGWYGGGDVVAYDGYYDDYYGPIYDGYWGNDGFYYRSHAGEAFHRDDAQHFRRESSTGFHHVNGNAHVPHGTDHRG